ncbi:MAG: DNA-3-methyladenine glycosylase [Nitrosopumilus sp.]
MLSDDILSRDFYMQETTIVAKKLLGKRLVRKINKKIISGIIIETEAYRSDDPASHTYTGMTERNKAMFGTVGCAYIYTTHGIYFCIDVVARNKRFHAGGVLIRSLYPDTGIDIMEKNRQTNNFKNLTNGPAKLTQALQIDKKLYGVDLTKQIDLYITEGIHTENKIQSSPRVGISKAVDKNWNFKLIF